jgi:hypothetical protein
MPYHHQEVSILFIVCFLDTSRRIRPRGIPKQEKQDIKTELGKERKGILMNKSIGY